MILEGKRGKYFLAFMDDLSVGFKIEDNHLIAFAEVLDPPYAAGVRLKLSKCAFGVRKVEILGLVVDEEGLRP